MVVQILLIFTALIALLIILISFVGLASDKKSSSLDKDFWAGARNRYDVEEFDSYIRDGEFRLTGLLFDAAAPIVHSDDLRVCLPPKNHYLYFKVDNDGTVNEIRYYIGSLNAGQLARRKTTTTWGISRSSEKLLIVNTKDVLMPCNMRLTRSAALLIYNAVLGRVALKEASGN